MDFIRFRLFFAKLFKTALAENIEWKKTFMQYLKVLNIVYYLFKRVKHRINYLKGLKIFLESIK